MSDMTYVRMNYNNKIEKVKHLFAMKLLRLGQARLVSKSELEENEEGEYKNRQMHSIKVG